MAKGSDNQFPYIHLVPAAAPANPTAGERLYLDSADGNKLKRRSTAGVVTTIEGGGGGATTPTVRASGSGYATTASFNVTIPAGAAVGDILVLMVASHNSTTGAVGFANAASTSGSFHNTAIMVRTCVSGDPGSTVSVTQSAAAGAAWHIVAVAGGSRIVEFNSVQQGTTGTSLSTGDLIRKGGGLLLVLGSVRGVTATLTPTGRAGESFASVNTGGGGSDISSQMWSAPAKGPGLVTVTSSVAPSTGMAVGAINVV